MIDPLIDALVFHPVCGCPQPGCTYVVRVSDAEPRKVLALLVIGLAEHLKAAHPEAWKERQ